MSEFKGTPGPWVFDHYESLRQASGGSVTLRGTTTLSSGPSESLEEARANTRLCAAAPDLLQTLKALVARIDYYASLPDRSEVNIEDWAYTAGSDDMNAARTAIAKALGQ